MSTSPDYWSLLAKLNIPSTYKANRSWWALESHGSHTVNGVQMIPGAPGFDPKAAYLTWTTVFGVPAAATGLTLTGTNGNDTLTGGAENDTFTGGAGADSLIGGGGNDTFNVTDTASDANDTIDGGAGTGDTIVVAAGQTIVFAANDAIITGVENVILGAAASVTLTGQTEGFNITASTGNEMVVGGDGNDTIIGGAGADSINAGAGTNTITDAGQGADTITHNAATSTVAIAVTGTDTVTLTASQAGATATSASGVNTTVNASTSTAAVTLIGGSGNDSLTGGSNSDSLVGNSGDDTITGGAGYDFLTGGLGRDLIYSGGDASADNIYIGVVIGASSDSGTVPVGASNNDDLGEDTIGSWDSSSDWIAVVASNVSSFLGGSTRVTVGTAAGGVVGSAAAYAANVGLIDMDEDGVFNGVSDIAVTLPLAITEAQLRARTQFYLTGTTGNDTLVGGSANDRFTGGEGADSLSGGDGIDTFIVTSTTDDGNDTINGGNGNDTISVTAGSTLTLSNDSNIQSIETFSLRGAANLDLTGQTENLSIDGSIFNDTINGGSGNDTINGSNGNDTINGGSGNDTINGSAGDDSLIGGAGNDVFVYTTASHSNASTAIDRITDLVLNGASADKLDFTLTGTLTVRTATVAANLSAADTIAEITGLFNSTNGTESAAERFTGGANATAILATMSDGTLLVVDVNGDGAFTTSDVVINVTGVTVTNFTTACFV